MNHLVLLVLFFLISANAFKSPLALVKHHSYQTQKRLTSSRGTSKLQMSTPQYDIGPPPDLPSLLLSNRVIYLGMSIMPSVTELVIAQLLHLNNEGDAPITMYINSPGTNAPDGKAYSYDTEAFAIADTMQFIVPPIHTICIGQAHGTAAMLLSLGARGHRAVLPNASILLHQPRSRARGSTIDVAIKAKEINISRQITNEFLSQTCGKELNVIEQETSRMKYLSPEEAVAFGLIDRVLTPGEKGPQPNFLNYLKK